MKRMHFLLTLTLALGTTGAYGGDWSDWRGPTQNGVAYETGLPAEWTRAGKNVIWKAPFGGRTTPHDVHHVGLSYEFLGTFLNDTGFRDIKRVEDFGLFDDTSVQRFSGVPIGLNVEARK